MSMELLSESEVRRNVRELVQKGRIAYTHHSEVQMCDRGFTRDDVRRCLTAGQFSERPCVPNNGGDIQYKFTMHAVVDGRSIDVAASLYPERNVAVITVIDT